MKFSGVVLAIAAAMPLASAIPFRIGNPLSLARAAVAEAAPATIEVDVAPRNLTARAFNETETTFEKRNATVLEARNVTGSA